MKAAVDILGLLGLVILLVMLGLVLDAKSAPDPFAAEDANGVVYLWPGSLPIEPSPARFTIEPWEFA